MNRAEIARQRLLSNLKTLTEDVEELMKATAEQADDGLSSLRGQVRRTLQSIRDQLIQKEDILKEARHGADVAISYAQARPWATLGILTGAAMTVGILLWSRCLDKEQF
jgi:ElaB/YqjD/DUF883 family membrane-anchored ribosome-binding protein